MLLKDFIRQARGTRSQVEVSEAAQISRQQLVNIEKGKGCTVRTLLALCRALGIKTIDCDNLQQ